MKKNSKISAVFLAAAVFLCLFLAGCGKEEGPAEQSDIHREEVKGDYGVGSVDASEGDNYVCVGVQFYQGDRVQIWGEKKSDGGGVYLHREDGTRELLMENVDGYFLDLYSWWWWLDRDGRCFLVGDVGGSEIVRPDMEEGLRPDKEKGVRDNFYYDDYIGAVFRKTMDAGGVRSICQLEDGRIIVLVQAEGMGWELCEMDPDTGALEKLQEFDAASNEIALVAAEGNSLLQLDTKGIWDFSLKDGTRSPRLSFEGTSYSLKFSHVLYSGDRQMVIRDLRILEDGRAELLWGDGRSETLAMEAVNQERKTIVLRNGYVDPWVKERIVRFNQESRDYYVVVEECTDSEYDSFNDNTLLELGAGRGADIICGIYDPYSLMEKGVFEDLSPYMKESGIREEDYFPATFTAWKSGEKVYGALYAMEVYGQCMVKAVTGEEGVHTVEELLDRMLGYEGEAVFRNGLDATGVLRYFLEYSENLFGMVDWENGTCDFGGDLFGKLLEAAKRYGYDERKGELESIAGKIEYKGYYEFNDAEYLEENGIVPIGYPFDDGEHTMTYSSYVMAINSGSENKEGAWEFIKYMLEEESQTALYKDYGLSWIYNGFPVNKSAFEKTCDLMKGNNSESYRDTGDLLPLRTAKLSKSRREDLRAALEDARSAPLRTRPLLDIILEESAAYFAGEKSVDEVRTVVESRIGMYLGERR